MQSKRPRIAVPYEQIDIIVELVNITILILIWGYAIMQYAELPDTIPIHFDASGNPDAEGSKLTIWILPIIATFMFMMLFVLNRFPHLHNYMVNITEENALKNYRLSTRILRFVNLYCLLLLAVLVFDIVTLTKGGETTFLGVGLIISSILVPMAIVVLAFYYQKKINN